MAEMKCEMCLYCGVCQMPVGVGCEDFESEEDYVEAGRMQYRDAFESYLDAFENG